MKIQKLGSRSKLILFVTAITMAFSLMKIIGLLFPKPIKISFINLVILPVVDPLTSIYTRILCPLDFHVIDGCSYPLSNILISFLATGILSIIFFIILNKIIDITKLKRYFTRILMLFILFSILNITYMVINVIYMLRNPYMFYW